MQEPGDPAPPRLAHLKSVIPFENCSSSTQLMWNMTTTPSCPHCLHSFCLSSNLEVEAGLVAVRHSRHSGRLPQPMTTCPLPVGSHSPQQASNNLKAED